MGSPHLPINHNMHRRAAFHNYARKGTYLITLVALNRKRIFGTLNCQSCQIELTTFGREVAEVEINKITKVYPNVIVWKLCVMPDHLHLILRINEDMPRGKHLGNVVSGFKYGCTVAYRNLTGTAHEGGIFEPNYNDRILIDNGQLDRWRRYLDDNPRRLAIKRLHPDYFVTKRKMIVAGKSCETFGNEFLLNIPDKEAVVVHRADDEAAYEQNKSRWLACGERGGVIVGTGIAPREKLVMRTAMDRGYAVILLRNNGFPELYKPSGEAFDACAQGKLLQISPWEYKPLHHELTRAECLELNRLAEAIANS